MKRRAFVQSAIATSVLFPAAGAASAARKGATAGKELRGTGDLGIVVERASGSVLIVDTTNHTVLARVEGLGDLSHASAVFSRDERYAYLFGRDGGLTKVDLLGQRIAARRLQAGNAIGGAISDDGRLVAVSNYRPGGVRVFGADDLEPLADIPATFAAGQRSKVVGLTDAPGRRFVFTLYDAGEIWIADLSDASRPNITKFKHVGAQPYDALISADGRHYIAGLYGEDGLAHLDLWAAKLKVKRILRGYGRGEQRRPVYKMPHLEGWAEAAGLFLFPAVGRHEVLAADARSFEEVARISVHGQPVFVIARPDGRHAWVNFALPHNDTVQVIDVPARRIIHTMKPGPGVLHMEFAPRGHEVWISVRDGERVAIYDTSTFTRRAVLPAKKPSGIFFTARAHRTGV